MEEVEWTITRFAVLAGLCWLHALSAWCSKPGCADTAAPATASGQTRLAWISSGLLVLWSAWTAPARWDSYSSINLGAIGSAAYYFNDYLGAAAVYTDHPSGANDGASGISGGPIFACQRKNFTLFAHTLFGTERLGGPNSDPPATFEARTLQMGTWDDGRRRRGLRHAVLRQPLQPSSRGGRLSLYSRKLRHLCRSPDERRAGRHDKLNAVELSAGIVTHFGHIVPPPPVTYSCSVCSVDVFPGDPITVTGTAMNLNPKKTAATPGRRMAARSREHQHGDRRHHDCGPGHLHGQGPCVAGREAWPDGGLLRDVHGEGLRSADHQLLGESFFGQSGRQLDNYGERGEPAEPPPDL